MIRVHLSGIYKGNDNGQFVTLELLSATSKCMLSIRHYHFFSLRLGTGTKNLLIIGMIFHCTKVRFASFLSGGFIAANLVNPPERKLAKPTSVDRSTAHDFMVNHSTNSTA